jgi:Zn-dependent M28 family amino/carboxypeptidase
MKPSMGLELVAYDLEESGLVGSREHCNKLRREGAEVVGMLSLEMLGFTGEDQVLVAGVETERARGDFLAIVANESSAHLLKMFDGIDLALPMERVVAPMGTEAGALSYLSDHGSFWDAGLPALLVTDTALLRNPHYHRSTDLPATLDYDFLTASTEAVLSAVRRFTA